MPRPQKINIAKLEEMLSDEGKTQAACAAHFGVTPAAISIQVKKLGIAVVRNTAMEHAPVVVKKKLNAIEQLEKINENANELLDLCMKWQRGDKKALRILESQVRRVVVGAGKNKEAVREFKFKDPRDLALRAMSEIRGQLGVQLEIFKTLYDVESVREFMNEIIELLAETSPELRNTFIQKVKEKKALNSALDIHGS